jgi:hypothetical protein
VASLRICWRAPSLSGTSVLSAPPQKMKKAAGFLCDHPTSNIHIGIIIDSSMEDPTAQTSPLRQPKKRFVGRRTADAQAQKDGGSGSQQDVESTSVQRGMKDLLKLYTLTTGSVILTLNCPQPLHDVPLEP